MSEQAESVQDVARRWRTALESADLSGLGDLLDPEVKWGPPGDPSPPCRTREEVIAWYTRGRDSGTRAEVSEVAVLGNLILVGLEVVRSPSPGGLRGRRARWQVLTVHDGLVVDIVGFDRRSEALAHTNVAAD
ncbi:MAG: nuclear transport factor 2 family protein [Acidimicrobiales bacterium]|jgi:hypothetical protein